MMTLLDEYSRQSVAIQVERQITAAEVLGVLEQAMIQYGVSAISAVTMTPSLSPLRSNDGCATTRSRRYILIRVARGKMDISKVFTAVFVTNA